SLRTPPPPRPPLFPYTTLFRSAGCRIPSPAPTTFPLPSKRWRSTTLTHSCGRGRMRPPWTFRSWWDAIWSAPLPRMLADLSAARQSGNSMGHHGRQGAAAEHVAVPWQRVYRLPEGVDADTAVAVVHPAATAHLALHRYAVVNNGETVFIGGGAGHVGSAAVVMAAQTSRRVITSRSEEHTSELQSRFDLVCR